MTDAIVVAGGDSARRFQLISNLKFDQSKIAVCQSLRDFRRAIVEYNVKAILLLCPDKSGIIQQLFDCNMITEIEGRIKLILISPSPAENNLTRLLNYKADEFLIEPVSQLEIANLINTLLDSRTQNGSRDILKIGDLELDRTSLTATLRTVRLPLHPIQVRVLELLMPSPGRVFTRREILDNIWSYERSMDDRTIDVTIGRIRNALRHKVSVDPIRTIMGVGYAF